jgi:hypothetical protein
MKPAALLKVLSQQWIGGDPKRRRIRPIGHNSETVSIIAGSDVQVNQFAAGRDKQANIPHQARQHLTPPGNAGPKVISPKALLAVAATLRRVTQRTIAPVEHIVGTEQPMIVESENHGHTPSIAGYKGSQRGPGNVVHVNEVRPYTSNFGGYNPVGAGVKGLYQRVIRQRRHIGHFVDGDLLDTVLGVDGFRNPVVDNQHRDLYPSSQ